MNDFESFKAEAVRAIQTLGLTDWNIEVRQAWLPDGDEECRARTWMNWTQRAARINWNENHRQKADAVIEQTPEQYAWHEVLHIALNPLVMVALERKEHGANEVDAEEHALIRRLMKALK